MVNNYKLNISIVICVADDVRIKKMLSSIQDPCEVVIVLNGASQEVIDIVKSFSNSNVFSLKIVSIAERNLSKARNVGAENATFDKVVFFDSDCVVVGNAISAFEKKLENHLLVDGHVNFLYNDWQSEIVAYMRSQGIPGFALCPSMGFNKRIKQKIGYFFDEDIQWIEDSELNHRCKKANVKVDFIEEETCQHAPLSFYQDLKSAFKYGSGVKKAAKKGLHKKRPTANWFLIKECRKKSFGCSFYCLIWNIVYCFGYLM